MSEQQMVHKFTLGSGKIIYIAEMDQKKEEMAFQLAAPKANGNELLLSYHAVSELVKLLIVGIQEKADAEIWKPGATDQELLHKKFTYKEMKQVREAIGKVMGEDQMPVLQPEIVPFGTL